jgi:hypothetical protein
VESVNARVYTRVELGQRIKEQKAEYFLRFWRPTVDVVGHILLHDYQNNEGQPTNEKRPNDDD